ncbi:MAG: SDR family NAD(P)-dependent oxidoreductase, partial [Gammaproteobacteria bacterium]|nr:SDR family NAD(P)-dependent oxidoreductase [Gammaproteobacteria bacterium]
GITSVAGLRGRGKNYIYGSTKAAFIAYLNGLRNSLTKYNVNILTVIPGFIKTKKSMQTNLPKFLFTNPKALAINIFDSQQANRGIIYSAFIWRVIMLIIKIIPDFIFKRMSI